jgi:hypothetical protein
MHGQARDFPTADARINQFSQNIEMAAIGYRWNIEELAVAARLGIPLDTVKGNAARRAAEEFIDDIVFRGSTDKGYEGLINQSSGITTIDAAAVGNSNGGTNSRYWMHKTADQIMADVNTVLTNVFVESLGVEIADTLLMPLESMTLLGQMQMSQLNMTVLEWIVQHNIVKQQTGRDITIRAIRGLETADDAGGGRVVAYRRDPGVLRFYMPMPHRFLPVFQEDPFNYFVPGIFRIGGLDIRRPMAMRYLDQVSPVPT